MKQLIITVLLAIVTTIIPLSTNSGVITETKKQEVTLMIEKWEAEQDSIKNLNSFLNLLALKESMNTWDTINQYGYVGKYQFGFDARQDVGVKDFTWRQFKSNPDIWPEHEQDEAVVRFMKFNHKEIFRFFNKPGDHLVDDHFNKTFTLKYSTKWYNKGDQVQLTWSGIYAACHLVGPGNVRRFLNTSGRFNKKDGNGITTFDYLKYFSNQDMKPIS